MTTFLQNDVLVFAFLFAHNVPYQHSAIMINVVFPKPLTPQPLSHALSSLSTSNLCLHSHSFSRKTPFMVKFLKLLLFSNFVSMLTIF